MDSARLNYMVVHAHRHAVCAFYGHLNAFESLGIPRKVPMMSPGCLLSGFRIWAAFCHLPMPRAAKASCDVRK